MNCCLSLDKKKPVSEFFCRYQARNVIEKDTLSLVFSCHFCEIIKDTFFIEHLRWLLLPILKLLDSQLAFLCLFLARTSFFLHLDGPVVEKIWRFWFSIWPHNWSVTWLFRWGSLILSQHPTKFSGHGPCECGDKTFLICHLTVWSMCHVTLLVGLALS